ncbi:hypothetical protein GCM10011586_39740 [Silvibacterium dinghuense]|nr:hypothetical protein GCM10011586_39740 [Silvibacterium dinghuense]
MKCSSMPLHSAASDREAEAETRSLTLRVFFPIEGIKDSLQTLRWYASAEIADGDDSLIELVMHRDFDVRPRRGMDNRVTKHIFEYTADKFRTGIVQDHRGRLKLDRDRP